MFSVGTVLPDASQKYVTIRPQVLQVLVNNSFLIHGSKAKESFPHSHTDFTIAS